MPKILMRRDTAATWAAVNPTLSSGEWALETDTGKMKLGDGQTAWNSLDYYTEEDKEWEKPADWPDIRSGALPNSVYFLVGHTDDYSHYHAFGLAAYITSSGAYDVYIDGVKYCTSTSGTRTDINWETLGLSSGYTVTYPSELVTHVVRVSPTDSSNKITAVQCRFNRWDSGLLWSHYSVNYPISLYRAFGEDYFSVGYCGNLRAVTAVNDKILLTTSTNAFRASFVNASNIQHIPVIEGQPNVIYDARYTFSALTSSHHYSIRLKNLQFYSPYFCHVGGTGGYLPDTQVPILITENCKLFPRNHAFTPNHSYDNTDILRRIPEVAYDGSTSKLELNDFIVNAVRLEPTTLDFSSFQNLSSLGIYGKSSSHSTSGLKGLTVSNQAPFDSDTSPQLNVNYTGLDRSALVTLFQSMPYNVAYDKIGNPTIVDGVASGFVNRINYLVSTSTFSVINFTDCEFCWKSNNNSSSLPVFAMGADSGLWVDILPTSRKLRVKVGNDTAFYFSLPNAYTATDNFFYKLKFVNYKCSFYFGATSTSLELIDEHQFEPTNTAYNALVRIGSENFNWSEIGWQGSIDLNETYIKVNGKLWFGPGVTKNLVPGGTLVGSPTITNGIASGFSSSKYIKDDTLGLTSDDMENDFTYSTIITRKAATAGYVLTTNDNWRATGILLEANGKINGWYSAEINGTAYMYNVLSTDALSLNSSYKITWVKTGNSLTLTILNSDGTTFFEGTKELTDDYTPHAQPHLCIGYGASGVAGCSVDLNNTYIKVGSDYVYRGMIPQVKTCSVVGCTGTSSLTAADKAIVTDKGWSLTVS